MGRDEGKTDQGSPDQFVVDRDGALAVDFEVHRMARGRRVGWDGRRVEPLTIIPHLRIG